MKYTIIIPMYNSEKTIKHCLNSIINQTYKNLEIIIVDDGSKDTSLLICKNYQKKDKRIIILKNKTNKGPAYSRNKALKITSGDYIGYVDSDDTIPKNYIEIINSLNKKYDCIIVPFKQYGKIEKIKHTGAKHSKKVINELINSKIPICGKFINKKFKNIKFKEDLIICEDSIYFIEIFARSKKIYLTNKTHYNYIYNTNSITTSKKDYEKKYKAYIKVIEYLQELKNKYTDFDYNLSRYLDNLLLYFYKYTCTMNYKSFEKELKKLLENKIIKENLYSNNYKTTIVKKITVKVMKSKLNYLIFIFYKLKRMMNI